METSALGRLLMEISWEGKRVTRLYRKGGTGLENVLTAEVMLALDFLPRAAFLGGVARAAHGADRARHRLAQQAEQATVTLLPGAQPRGSSSFEVQPDALISSDDVHGFVEAKRKGGKFNPQQLAKQFVVLQRDAGRRKPLLLLLVAEDPLSVAGDKRKLTPAQAIAADLPAVLASAGEPNLHVSDLLGHIDDTLAWITWGEVREAVERAASDLAVADASIASSIQRVAQSLVTAIVRHS